MTEHRSLAAGEDRRHPPAVRRETKVPDRIHPSVKPVEPAPLGAHRDRVLSQPGGNELRKRDDAVLPLGDAGDAMIGCGAFFPHVGE